MLRLIGRITCLGLVVLLHSTGGAHALDNLRVAHPSLSASVLCLMIAGKEGYFKEEGIKASGWKL